MEADRVSAKKLCTAFGIRAPLFLDGQPDQAYYSLLGLGISRELARRQRLSQYSTLDDVVSLLQKSRKIIAITGAGISTSLGIPDFRSPSTGLYARLEDLGLSDPQEVFDISLFREDPSIFYSIAKDILPSTNAFSPTHAFIRLLQDKDKLLTNYTQNIDNLEEYAGISKEKLIQCHGSFATAACLECGFTVAGDTIYEDIKACRIPQCQMCIARLHREKELAVQRGTVPTISKRKRHSKGSRGSSKRPKKSRRPEWEDSSSASENDQPSKGDPSTVAGVMKPAITFFGEALPSLFHDRLIEHDRTQVDLVIVIGTSLKVAPVSEIPSFLPKDVPQIYISRESCKHIDFDVELLGECDVIVQELCRRAGWGSLEDVAKGAKGELGGKCVEQAHHVTGSLKPGGDVWKWQVGCTL